MLKRGLPSTFKNSRGRTWPTLCLSWTALVCTVSYRGWISKLLGAFDSGLVGDKAELGNDHQEQRTPES